MEFAGTCQGRVVEKGQVRKGNRCYFTDITLRCNDNLRKNVEYDYPVQILSSVPIDNEIRIGDRLIVRGWLETKEKLFRINAYCKDVIIIDNRSPLNQNQVAFKPEQGIPPQPKEEKLLEKEGIPEDELPF
jgi:hypothetical protein